MCKSYLYDTRRTMLFGFPTCEGLGIVKINLDAPKMESVNIDVVKDRGNGNEGALVDEKK